MKRIFLVLVLVTLTTTSSANPYGDFGINFTDTWQRSNFQQDVMRRGRAGGRPREDLTVIPSRYPRIPQTLAAASAHSPDERSTLEGQYRAMLKLYDKLAAKLKLTQWDLAGALGLLVATSYAAYHDGDLSQPGLAATVGQVREMILASPTFTKMATDKRQDAYEQVALVSATLAITLEAAKTDPSKRASLRAMGREYLAYFGDPDRIVVSDRGVSLAQAK